MGFASLNHIMNRLAKRNLSDPTGGRVAFLSKEHAQMCGMFLDMPHVIDEQLGDGLNAPVIADSLGLVFICKALNFGLALGY